MNKLDKAICINLEVSIWQGRRVLHVEDLRVSSSSLPPAELATLGSKKIIDPEDIKIFNTLKKKAERICANKSVRFLGGYATSKDSIQEIVSKLDVIKHSFEQAKLDFLSSYEKKIADWIDQFPEWKDVLENAVIPKGVVENRICFEYQVFQIQPANDIDGEISPAGISKATDGLSDQLFKEISKDAEAIWDRSIRSRDKVSLKVISPIRKLVEKLSTLSFLDSRVINVIEVTNNALAKLPKVGPLEGQELLALIGIVDILSSKDKMCSFSEVHPNEDDEVLMKPDNVVPIIHQQAVLETEEPTIDEIPPQQHEKPAFAGFSF